MNESPKGILLPFNHEKKDAKEVVLETLAKAWPLTAKQIYSKASNKGQQKYTYQGIHKALGQLLNQRVLQYSEGKYSIHPKWVSKLKRFTQDLEFAYLKNKPVSVLDLAPYSSVSVEWEGILVEPYYWVLDQEYKVWESVGPPLNTVLLQRRAWPLPLGEEESKKFYQIFRDNEQFALAQYCTKVDRALLEAWKKINWKCAYVPGCASNSEVLSFNEFVIQIFHPNNTKKEWDRIYAQIDDDAAFPLYNANKVAFELRTKASMVITRNKEFAQKILMEAKNNYKNYSEV